MNQKQLLNHEVILTGLFNEEPPLGTIKRLYRADRIECLDHLAMGVIAVNNGMARVATTLQVPFH